MDIEKDTVKSSRNSGETDESWSSVCSGESKISRAEPGGADFSTFVYIRCPHTRGSTFLKIHSTLGQDTSISVSNVITVNRLYSQMVCNFSWQETELISLWLEFGLAWVLSTKLQQKWHWVPKPKPQELWSIFFLEDAPKWPWEEISLAY